MIPAFCKLKAFCNLKQSNVAWFKILIIELKIKEFYSQFGIMDDGRM